MQLFCLMRENVMTYIDGISEVADATKKKTKRVMKKVKDKINET